MRPRPPAFVAATLLALSLVVLSSPVLARQSDPEAPRGLESPRATLRTFLGALSADPPELEVAATCLESKGTAAEALPGLVARLYRIVNRIELVDLERDPSIPDAEVLRRRGAAASDAWTFFPREAVISGRRSAIEARLDRERLARLESAADGLTIAMVRGDDGGWRFSRRTVEAIDELWLRLREFPTVAGRAEEDLFTVADRIERLWPERFVTTGFLGVRTWQWISIALLVFAGVVLDLLVRSVLAAGAGAALRRRGRSVERESIARVVRPFGLAVTGLLWLWSLHLLGLPSAALKVLSPTVRLFAMIAMVWSGLRLADLLGELAQKRAARTTTRFDDLLVPLVRKSAKVLVVVLGLVSIAGSLDIEIAPLLTGLGIGGLGFAFAAKDTIENFFGSVAVVIDHPFQVGDWVTIGDVEGVVEELGLRSVRIRTFYNSVVTIPSANLVRASVDNYGRRRFRRWKTHLNLEYGTPPERVEAFCEGVRELVRLHPYTRKDSYQVWFHEFGPHSLDVLVYLFFETPDWPTELRERHRLMLDILRLAGRLGVAFAFPTRTLHVVRDGGGEVEPPDLPAPDEEIVALRGGRHAARDVVANASWRDRRPEPYRFRSADETALLDGGDG